MRLYRLSDLYPAEVLLGGVAYDLSGTDADAVAELYIAAGRLYGCDKYVAIRLDSVGFDIEVVSIGEDAGRATDPGAERELDLDPSPWRIPGVKNEIVEIEVAGRPGDVLHLYPLDLYLLDQLLVVRIKGIQCVDQVVLHLVGGRIVEGEQGVEVLAQGLLRGLAAQLLGLVQDDDRTGGGDDVDGLPGPELVTFIVDYPVLLLELPVGLNCEGLGVDDHDVDAGIAGEIIERLKVLRIVHEEADLLPVVLHEMVLGDLERLLHALTYCDAGDDHYELAPPVALVELEHRLDVDIGLPSAGLHLDIEGANAEAAVELGGAGDLIPVLDRVDVPEKVISGEDDIRIRVGIDDIESAGTIS